jgi:type IV pilus assembly protein PilA
MLKNIRKSMQDDKGFTLIELMVVVLIIAILIAIAIPTFLGLRRRAQDRAAQSNLRNALTAAKAYFTDDEVYTGFVGTVDGEDTEPSLTWADGNAVALNTVNVAGVTAAATTTPQEIMLQTLSQSNTSFCIADSSEVGTVKGEDADGTPGAFTDFAGCSGAGPDAW